MEKTSLVLEYWKVFLSPQTVAATVIVLILLIFKEDIKDLMRRIAKIRLPGGSELSTSQIERTNKEFEPKGEKPPTTPPEKGSLPETLSLTLTSDQALAVRQHFEAERAKAALWEYRYLNYFLALGTQRVLDWLASLKTRTTATFFDSLWLPLIPNAEERKAILNALQAHHLIVITGELIEVTPKGTEYLQWRGPLPASAS